MSSHEEIHEDLSPEEAKYRLYMTRGEDFLKIEIFRNSRKYYQMAQAMNLNTDTDLIKEKIAYCNKMIRKERNILIAIGAVAVVVAGIILCVTTC